MGAAPIDSSSASSQSITIVVAEPGVLQHDDRAAQRAERHAVGDEHLQNFREDAGALRADEVTVIEQSTHPPERLAEHLGEVGHGEPGGLDNGDGFFGHLHYRTLAGRRAAAAGMHTHHARHSVSLITSVDTDVP